MPIYFPPLPTQASAATGSMMPTVIATGDTFTIPTDRQALFAMPIIVDGTLVIDGYLIGVD